MTYPALFAQSQPNAADARSKRVRKFLQWLSLPLISMAWVTLGAQDVAVAPADVNGGGTTMRFESAHDSLDWENARRRAESARGMKLVLDLFQRRLYAVDGADTLLNTQVAIGRGTTLEHDGRKWVFKTPRGTRSIIKKTPNPVWVPPDWHYVEVAQERGFELRQLKPGKPVVLKDGSRLEVRGKRVVLTPFGSTEFKELPTDEEIVFDNTLFIPPIGSDHRRVEGELGRYSLSLGDGYMLHGTPHQWSIGTAASHGCIRMRDEDIALLFDTMPLGTKIYIY